MKPARSTDDALDATGLRCALVASRFHEDLVEQLLGGALDRLARCGVERGSIDVHRVPGSFELSQAARWLAETGRYDAIVCLGVLIRGETRHFDFIAAAAAQGISRAAEETGVPVAFGVLTTDSVEQALERAGGRLGNKGEEAARAAVEMALLRRAIAREGA